METTLRKIVFWVQTPNGGRFQETKSFHPDDCSEETFGETFRDWLMDEVVDYGWDIDKTIKETNHVKYWVKTPNGGYYESIKKVHIDDSKEEMLSEIFRDWLWDEVVTYGWHSK